MKKSKDKKAASELTAASFIKRLKALASKGERKKYERYFPGENDFIGVRMGSVFALAKEFIELPVKEIEKLLESHIHEIRAGACSLMGKSASAKKTPESLRKELYDLYLRRHDRINNWDLVDLASYKVVGSYLYDFDKPRAVLYKLAKSKDTWERRTAVVSTLYFVAKNDLADAFKIAELLVNEKEDLVNKGSGWVLRAAGAKDRAGLLKFLDKHAAKMPRITLRYAIEHLSKQQRDHCLGLKKAAS